MKTQAEEISEAFAEGRQPICVACGKALDVICQHMHEYLYWVWNEELKRYVKSDESGDADTPYHEQCDNADWDYLDSEKSSKLGLDY